MRKTADQSKREQPKVNLWRVLGKALLIFIFLILLIGWINPPIKTFFLFNNRFFKGYQRLPVLWTPDRHLNNTEFFERSFIDKLDLMLAAHEVSARKKPVDEYWVFIYGDSSVWGTALYPNETLAGQMNAMNLQTCDGRKIVAFNLGYPSNAALKDVVIMDQTRNYQPDMSVWLFSMLAFTRARQVVPFIEANPEYTKKVVETYNLNVDISGLPISPNTVIQKTIFEKRLDFHLLINLYASRIITAAIGADDPRAASEREITLNDSPKTTLDFYGIQPTDDLKSNLVMDTLSAAYKITDGNLIYINEPIYLKQPVGNAIAYNSAFPIWAYDEYRSILNVMAKNGNWNYHDLGDLLPNTADYSTSIFHLRPDAEKVLAGHVSRQLLSTICP